MPARKTEALLAVLALRPGVALGREWLAALLWPDAGDPQSRTSLRQAVSHLRRSLGEAAVVATADRLHLDPALVSVDVARVERLIAGPAVERAPVATLYVGELLRGFGSIEDPFERWLVEERTRLADRVAVKMEECLAALSALGKLEPALAVGTWLLGQDPTRESVHRALMRLHAERGDRVAALRQLERCRSALDRQLGIAPSRETQALAASLHGTADEPPPASTAAHTEDGRLRLAILPFEVLSDEGSAPVVALALTEDLRTELARFRQLALLALDRNDAATAGGRARLVLRGSVRLLGERTRVTASLIDTATELQLWAEKWESASDEVFHVLDRITRSVVGELALKIDEARLAWTRGVPRERLAAYECWLRGMECLRRGSPEADEEARDYFVQALKHSPNFARAYAGLSLTHFNDWSCQAWDRWELRERLACENAERAAELDDSDHVPQYILARVWVYRREFARAERHIENALRLNPNDPDALVHAASVLNMLGEPVRAQALMEEAMRLNPKPPDWYFSAAGTAQFFARRPDDAIRWLERAPDALVDTRALLGAASFHTGNVNVGREQIARFLVDFERKISPGQKSTPGEALAWLFRVLPLRRESDAEYLRGGLVGAGL
jgi:DNA-binding SARP family transcriptional activator